MNVMRRGNGGEGEDIPLLIFIEGERCQIQQSLRQTKASEFPQTFACVKSLFIDDTLRNEGEGD